MWIWLIHEGYFYSKPVFNAGFKESDIQIQIKLRIGMVKSTEIINLRYILSKFSKSESKIYVKGII